MDAATRELQAAHDVLATLYADRREGGLERLVDRSLLQLLSQLVLTGGVGNQVADVGCGTGRLAPDLRAWGLEPIGLDLSRGMLQVARAQQPDLPVLQADARQLPLRTASLAGAIAWYSLMYLPEQDRPTAFSELARVVAPGGYVALAWKAGASELRRGGRGTGAGVEFDVYWLSPEEVQARVADAGFEPVVWAGRAAERDAPAEQQPQAYLLARRPD